MSVENKPDELGLEELIEKLEQTDASIIFGPSPELYMDTLEMISRFNGDKKLMFNTAMTLLQRYLEAVDNDRIVIDYDKVTGDMIVIDLELPGNEENSV